MFFVYYPNAIHIISSVNTDINMALSNDGSKAQITKSLSVAASDLKSAADSWANIERIIGLPEALYVVGKRLPILPIFLKSLESSIENKEETKDSKESFATANRFADLSKRRAKYFDAIFNAVSTTDNQKTAEEKYRIEAKKRGGKPAEAILKELLALALELTELVADECLKSSLQAAYDEVAELAPSLAEGITGHISMNNNGDGTQLYHNGQGDQNQCTGGTQYNGNGCTFHAPPPAKN